jgi:hypothetical protein
VITIASEKDVLLPKNLYVQGTIYGTLLNPLDSILKTNIASISEKEVDNLYKLMPKEFTYIEDSTNKKHYGLIAQDVEELYPELIDSGTGIKTVNYMELIPIIISKINTLEDAIYLLQKG